MKCIKINYNSKKGIKWAIYYTFINYVTYTLHLLVLWSQTAPHKFNLCPFHDRWAKEVRNCSLCEVSQVFITKTAIVAEKALTESWK